MPTYVAMVVVRVRYEACHGVNGMPRLLNWEPG